MTKRYKIVLHIYKIDLLLTLFIIYLQGGRIHATVRHRQIQTFGPIFNEGRIYAIKNFVLVHYQTFLQNFKRKMLKMSRSPKLFCLFIFIFII